MITELEKYFEFYVFPQKMGFYVVMPKYKFYMYLHKNPSSKLLLDIDNDLTIKLLLIVEQLPS